MKMIFIQGLGCTETGARIVLKELLKTAPKTNRYFVLCTRETAFEFIGDSRGKFNENIYVCGVSHAIFGRWLRPVLEVFIALLCLSRLFSEVINLSHYGLCLGGNFALYVHSPLLMDLKSAQGASEGRPNILKRLMLNSCIKRARVIILQTQGMAEQLRLYCKSRKLPLPRYRVMRPKIDIPFIKHLRREFKFQLFYPTSRFVHKRAELAISAAKLIHDDNDNVGLVITTNPSESSIKGIKHLGRISREEVYDWFAGSDALLFTSERETLGLPLLEAMEFGIPVIAPRLPYATELLGDAGCYFDEPTVESVAEAIECCRAEYDLWRSKILERTIGIRKDSATWAEHWAVLLDID